MSDEPGPTRRRDDGDVDAQALELFTESLELPLSMRYAWLADQCVGNARLLQEVLQLQDADHGAEAGFLESSPLASPDRSGQRVGPFELVEEIGVGGMGRVYRAKRADGAFEQEVAVKLFDARIRTPGDKARFHAERQILASLEHPGIARLIDGGTAADTTPYVVMELVRGQPITHYCEARKLDLPARLALFQRVCAALEVAHQRGVVHRDLKPGNVLVTDDGEPKLIDFGIAKVLRPETMDVTLPETMTRAQLLTPEYASPEQVRGQKVGPSSDVYSLGILMYELLTGSRPYQISTLTPAEIERTVCHSMPADPSDLVARRRSPPPSGLSDSRELRRALRGDLDRIVMTALRKEPGQRYASAAALSRDIERYLNGQPVAARGASTWYRAGKFIQRHRAGALAVLAIFIVLVGSLIVVARQAAEAQRQRDVARQEAARATAAKEFLVEIIGRSDPFENAESATLAGALRQSIPGIGERFGGQPLLEAEMRYAIGYALQNLGEIPAAREQLEAALALRETHGSRLDRAEALDGLGIINWWESNFEDGEVRFREALAQLGADNSEQAVLQRVETLANFAGMLSDAGRYAESAEISRQGLAIAEDAPFVALATLATLWSNLGTALSSIDGQRQAAVDALEKALDLQREATGEMHPSYAIALNNLALTHYELGDLEQSAELLARSLEIRRQTLGPDHPQTATALFNVAGVETAAGLYESAEEHALQALAVAQAGYAAGHPRIGKAHEFLSKVYLRTDRAALAQQHAQQALAIYRAAPGVDPTWIASVEGILAELQEP